MITADLVRYFLDKEAASSLGFGGDGSSGFDEDAKALAGRGGMSSGLRPLVPPQRETPNYEQPKAPKSVAKRVVKNPATGSIGGLSGDKTKAVTVDGKGEGLAPDGTRGEVVGSHLAATPMLSRTPRVPSADDKKIDQAVKTTVDKATGYASAPTWAKKTRDMSTSSTPLNNAYHRAGQVYGEDLKQQVRAKKAESPGYGKTIESEMLAQEDANRKRFNMPALVGKERERYAESYRNRTGDAMQTDLHRKGFVNPNIMGTGAAGDPNQQIMARIDEINTRDKRLGGPMKVKDPSLQKYAPQLDTRSVNIRQAVPGERISALREFDVKDSPFVARENVNTGEIDFTAKKFFDAPELMVAKSVGGKKINADDVANWRKQKEEMEAYEKTPAGIFAKKHKEDNSRAETIKDFFKNLVN